jgi:hypothetical protein
MKSLIALALLIASVVVVAQSAPTSFAKQKFVSSGTIRMQLEAGAYVIRPSDSDDIAVTWHARSEQDESNVKVAIKRDGSIATVSIKDTPNRDFRAIIEVPRRSDLRVRLSAGELQVEAVEGNKDLELRAGSLAVDVPNPAQYGKCDASVWTGSLEAAAFGVSKGGLFRSFEQEGAGKYRLHAHVMSGEINLQKVD